jgi:hypothetical protein
MNEYREDMGTACGKGVRSFVCDQCWNTLFAFDAFQRAWKAEGSSDGRHGGFTYSTTWRQLLQSAGTDCSWCKLLVAEIPGYVLFMTGNASPSPEDVFKVKVRFKPSKYGSSLETPVGRNTIILEINESYSQPYEVHTAPGTSATHFPVGWSLFSSPYCIHSQ